MRIYNIIIYLIFISSISCICEKSTEAGKDVNGNPLEYTKRYNIGLDGNYDDAWVWKNNLTIHFYNIDYENNLVVCLSNNYKGCAGNGEVDNIKGFYIFKDNTNLGLCLTRYGIDSLEFVKIPENWENETEPSVQHSCLWAINKSKNIISTSKNGLNSCLGLSMPASGKYQCISNEIGTSVGFAIQNNFIYNYGKKIIKQYNNL